MAQTYQIKSLTNDADTNTATPPQGAPEGMQRLNVSNTMRETMGAIRGDWDGSAPSGGSQWRDVSDVHLVTRVSDSQLRIFGANLVTSFPFGRKVKLTYSEGDPGYAYVSMVTYDDPYTIVTVADFDDASPNNTVRAGITNCLMASGFGDIADHGIGVSAYESMSETSVTSAYIAADAAVTSAYIAADAAVTSGYIAADAAVTTAYQAADAAVTTAYQAADAADAGRGFVVPTAFTGAALKAAVIEAGLSGKTVLLMKGTYEFAGPTDTIIAQSNMRIVGQGIGVTILQQGTQFTENIIKADTSDGSSFPPIEDVHLEGFSMDGNGNNTQVDDRVGFGHDHWDVPHSGTEAMVVNNPVRWTLKNIRVYHCAAQGLVFKQRAYPPETPRDIPNEGNYYENVHVDDCFWPNYGASQYVSQWEDLSYGNTFRNCGARLSQHRVLNRNACSFGWNANIDGFDLVFHSAINPMPYPFAIGATPPLDQYGDGLVLYGSAEYPTTLTNFSIRYEGTPVTPPKLAGQPAALDQVRYNDGIGILIIGTTVGIGDPPKEPVVNISNGTIGPWSAGATPIEVDSNAIVKVTGVLFKDIVGYAMMGPQTVMTDIATDTVATDRTYPDAATGVGDVNQSPLGRTGDFVLGDRSGQRAYNDQGATISYQEFISNENVPSAEHTIGEPRLYLRGFPGYITTGTGFTDHWMGDRKWPLPPDGRRTFLVEMYVTMNMDNSHGTGTNTVNLKLRKNSTFTVGSVFAASQGLYDIADTPDGDGVEFNLGPMLITPEIGEDQWWATIEVVENSTCTLRPNGYVPPASTRAIPGRSYIKMTYVGEREQEVPE